MTLQEQSLLHGGAASGGNIPQEKKSTSPTGSTARRNASGLAGLLLLRSSALQPLPQDTSDRINVNTTLRTKRHTFFFSFKMLIFIGYQQRLGRGLRG